MDFTQTIDEPSTSENVTVPRAGREYLLEHEVERLIEVAKGNRQGHRVNAAIVSGSDVTFALDFSCPINDADRCQL
jgi:hypothetical protein